MEFEISEAHIADIAWILALYIAIHGGDPSPSEVLVDRETVEIAAALVDRLAATFSQQEEAAFTLRGLEERFKARGLPLAVSVSSGQYCVSTEHGLAVCFRFPRGHLAV